MKHCAAANPFGPRRLNYEAQHFMRGLVKLVMRKSDELDQFRKIRLRQSKNVVWRPLKLLSFFGFRLRS